MKISVILCTFNRCGRLPTILGSIADQVLPDIDEWEILVVDNNSSDETRKVVAEIAERRPQRLRYMFEAQQGLSNARNTGIGEARGDVLVFVDDDVTVTPHWLRHLTAPFAQGECAGVGGRILPQWTSKPPRWLDIRRRYALAPFAIFDQGAQPGELREPPLGANMAFRKEMFVRYGGFRPDLGRSGAAMLSNEDTEFGGRLLRAGEKIYYEASAVVYHPVEKERLNKSYLLKWWLAKGRSDIRQNGPRLGARLSVHGVPLYLVRNLLRSTIYWQCAVGRGNRFQNKLKVWEKWGEIMECYEAAPVAAPRSRSAT